MQVKEICDAVTRLYLYADNTKFIHYSTPKNHMHKLCDEVRDEILKFVDELAESCFGFLGKPSYGDFSIKTDITTSDDLRNLCDSCMGVVAPIRTECEKDEKLSGVVSIIDDFYQYLGKAKFLCTFDKLSNSDNTEE